MKLLLTKLLLITYFVIFNSVWAHDPIIVKVGATKFPPYIDISPDEKVEGIISETINYINSIQNDYKFVAIPVSAMKRHEYFKKHVFDVSFYDNVEWGWDKSLVDVSKVFMRGKEVYIANAEKGHDEKFFTSFENKSIIGILGYHYGMANFNADPIFLRKNFNMQLSTSNESSIKMILYKRGDVAIVSDAYLHWYIKQHPEIKDKILISKKVDQYYAHTIIVRKNIRPTVTEINKFLTKFIQSDEFKSITNRYGVTP